MVRKIVVFGKMWYSAKDICLGIGIVNPEEAIDKFVEKEAIFHYFPLNNYEDAGLYLSKEAVESLIGLDKLWH